jgi:PfaD family protein
MGADYVLTGSVNQCARESGQSIQAKRMLAQAGVADVMMAPAGDMFELGVKVQVLKRGCFFPLRAAKLYELYKNYDSLEALPKETAAALERDFFRATMAQTWAETRAYFSARRPEEVTRAERDPKHRMALVFRWYLGLSSRWPLVGTSDRQMDYQIWCGPAMGAFNQWVAGSFLEDPDNRTVAEIALNLMHGAASITRAHQLRTMGMRVPALLFDFRPRPLTDSGK